MLQTHRRPFQQIGEYDRHQKRRKDTIEKIEDAESCDQNRQQRDSLRVGKATAVPL
ncbi:hypothetical protein SRABI106_03571 [Rahnella aquatilis]|nr:hypothetical protein SRABI106_03571 [Rahnella aquatilis]